MLEIKDVTIDERVFKLHPLKGMKALKLDKKVLSLLLPALKGLKGGLDTNIDIGTCIAGLSESIDNLPDAEYEKFLNNILSSVQYIPETEAPEEMCTAIIDTHFQGAPMTVYKLMFEVMKFNNFTPFALVGQAGGKINLMSMFSGLTKQASL